MRKHARHRSQGVGATRLHVAPADDMACFHLWGGIARVAIQTKVVCTRGFSHNQNQQGRFVPGCSSGRRCGSHTHALQAIAATQRGIFADGLKCQRPLEQRLERDMAERDNAGQRIDEVTNLRVVAHQRCHGLVQQQATTHQDSDIGQDQQC